MSSSKGRAVWWAVASRRTRTSSRPSRSITSRGCQLTSPKTSRIWATFSTSASGPRAPEPPSGTILCPTSKAGSTSESRTSRSPRSSASNPRSSALTSSCITGVSRRLLARVAPWGGPIRGQRRCPQDGVTHGDRPRAPSRWSIPDLALVGAHLCSAAAGKTWPRARAGTSALAGGPLLLDGRGLRRLGLLLVGEDLVLGLALEQGDELACLDGLAL